MKNLVIFTHRYTEDDRRHIFEAVDPLFTFRPLTSDVEQPETAASKNTLKPNAHLRRRRDSTVELRRVAVGGMYVLASTHLDHNFSHVRH